jgi:hypothetical protein
MSRAPQQLLSAHKGTRRHTWYTHSTCAVHTRYICGTCAVHSRQAREKNRGTHEACTQHTRGTYAAHTRYERAARAHIRSTRSSAAQDRSTNKMEPPTITRGRNWGRGKYTELNEQMGCLSEETQEVYGVEVTDLHRH